MDIFGKDYSAHDPRLPLQDSPTLPSFFVPISLKSPETEVDLGLVLVGWGCDGEGASSQVLDRQQNQAGWGLGLSKAAVTVSQAGEGVLRGKSKKGAVNQARLLHSSYPLGPRWISLTYASGPATDFPLELEGLGLSQCL